MHFAELQSTVLKIVLSPSLQHQTEAQSNVLAGPPPKDFISEEDKLQLQFFMWESLLIHNAQVDLQT